jgi:hypothetical protein
MTENLNFSVGSPSEIIFQSVLHAQKNYVRLDKKYFLCGYPHRKKEINAHEKYVLFCESRLTQRKNYFA